ncbi:MAG: hypothetical protein ACYDD2_08320 [Candidatus Acidiferrales bacterium]
MADFVINEWLWEDASGKNGTRPQTEALAVITTLAAADHRIVVIEGSPFEQKVWNLCKSSNIIVRTIVREFLGRLRYNLDRSLIYSSEAVTVLTEELASAIKPDDHYLVQAQLTATGAILVTTDAPLREVATKVGLTCLSREQFLDAYIREPQTAMK